MFMNCAVCRSENRPQSEAHSILLACVILCALAESNMAQGLLRFGRGDHLYFILCSCFELWRYRLPNVDEEMDEENGHQIHKRLSIFSMNYAPRACWSGLRNSLNLKEWRD